MGRKGNYSESYNREAVTKAKTSGNVSQTARELGSNCYSKKLGVDQIVTGVTIREPEEAVTDTQRLKENCDLRRLVEQDLGPAPLRGGRAYLWKCPFHNEHKGFSLAV